MNSIPSLTILPIVNPPRVAATAVLRLKIAPSRCLNLSARPSTALPASFVLLLRVPKNERSLLSASFAAFAVSLKVLERFLKAFEASSRVAVTLSTASISILSLDFAPSLLLRFCRKRFNQLNCSDVPETPV